jgi:porphobilinogen synthase
LAAAMPPPTYARGRLSRLRGTPALRSLVREYDLDAGQLVLPLFVSEVDAVPAEIPSMPGTYRWPTSRVAAAAAAAQECGVGAVLLLGIPAHKNSRGSGASADDGIVQRALIELRASGHHGPVVTDVCLCEYTDPGQGGLLAKDETIVNDASVERLAEIAVAQARAGADIVSSSATLDGQVAAIRRALDAAGFELTPIMSYSAKYTPAFNGPFRVAGGGVPDVAEGADILMVKPGLAYLDIVRRMREAFPYHPLAAYNVSGEYSMVKAAAERRWLDERSVVLETLLAFRRAGADLIVTYHAVDAARWLADGRA